MTMEERIADMMAQQHHDRFIAVCKTVHYVQGQKARLNTLAFRLKAEVGQLQLALDGSLIGELVDFALLRLDWDKVATEMWEYYLGHVSDDDYLFLTDPQAFAALKVEEAKAG